MDFYPEYYNKLLESNKKKTNNTTEMTKNLDTHFNKYLEMVKK